MSQRPARLVEGEHFYCGQCVGRDRVPCDYCVEGTGPDGRCFECKGVGEVACPVCQGGTVATAPPDYL